MNAVTPGGGLGAVSAALGVAHMDEVCLEQRVRASSAATINEILRGMNLKVFMTEYSLDQFRRRMRVKKHPDVQEHFAVIVIG